MIQQQTIGIAALQTAWQNEGQNHLLTQYLVSKKMKAGQETYPPTSYYASF